jgi:hypothetical protein
MKELQLKPILPDAESYSVSYFQVAEHAEWESRLPKLRQLSGSIRKQFESPYIGFLYWDQVSTPAGGDFLGSSARSRCPGDR